MKKIGVIAGDGSIPLTLINNLRSQNIMPFVISLTYGNLLYCILNSIPHLKCSIGELSKAIEFLKINSIKEIIIIGKVFRPNFSLLKPDKEAKKLLTKIIENKGGDNKILSTVINFLENEHDLQIIPAHEFLKELLLSNDIKSETDSNIKVDISIGINYLNKASEFDIGQAVVVRDQQIIAIEALEGTDEMLKRCVNLNKKHKYGGVLVKMPKQNQNIKIDLPTIGLNTLKLADKANLNSIAIQKNKCFVVDKDKIEEFISDKKLSLIVF
ncbi:MAG: UDP-2,3-diacylglucosamine diphosphatase LpxI [Sphingobacteriia bacterium]|nr:UDP-2,3-diacylglucosamine diphosphatase LpxI [Sphingobacteriia bacterium]